MFAYEAVLRAFTHVSCYHPRHRKRHGNGMYQWPDGESYQGTWYMGLPHGLGIAGSITS